LCFLMYDFILFLVKPFTITCSLPPFGFISLFYIRTVSGAVFDRKG
jgi:hypothetical protein